MGPADDVDAAARASSLWAKYGDRVDAESARELLAQRLAPPAPAPAAPHDAPAKQPARPPAPAPKGGTADAIGDFLRSSEGKRLQKTVTRGVLGMLRKRL
jgi:hypothetical protein